jgi:hypothetical protein
MLSSNFIKALEINRIRLYFCDVAAGVTYFNYFVQNNFISLMKFALLYNRLGFKRLSERLMDQA